MRVKSGQIIYMRNLHFEEDENKLLRKYMRKMKEKFEKYHHINKRIKNEKCLKWKCKYRDTRRKREMIKLYWVHRK